MKKLLFSTIVTISLVLGIAQISHAEESTGEKIKVEAKNTKRAMKKGIHKLSEKVCMKSDAKCLADKAKHRIEESSDSIKDKATELKDKID